MARSAKVYQLPNRRRGRGLGDLTDVSLTPWTPYDPMSVYTVPSIAQDLGWTPSDYSLQLPNIAPVDISSALNLSTPINMSGLNDFLPTNVLNVPTSAGSSGMSTNDWLSAITGLAQTGIQAYATVQQINHGAGGAYAFTPTNQPAVPVVAGAGTIPEGGFSLNSLLDFNTPTPYVIGGAIALFMAMRK